MMTWEAPKSRWKKMYRGVLYHISAKALGVPPTKGESMAAANAWWEAKQTEIDGIKTPAQVITEQVRDLLGRIGLEGLQRLACQGQAAGQVIGLIEYSGNGVAVVDEAENLLHGNGMIDPPNVNKVVPVCMADLVEGKIPVALTDAERVARVSDLRRRVLPEVEVTETEMTVGHQFERWADLQYAAKKSNARKKMNVHMLSFFVDFMKKATPVDAIDEEKWEAFNLHLAKLKKENGEDYDDGYKGRVAAQARNFIRWLHGKRLIDEPRNLADCGVKFEKQAKEIKVVDDDTIRTFFKGATGQTRLHILLGLNCGMLPIDISELRQAQVDLKAGTITRKRSKLGKLSAAKQKKVPTVTYRLWKSTLRLLKEYDSGKDPVLLTVSGQSWVQSELEAKVDGIYKNSNSIASNFRYLREKTEVDVTPKQLRTAAASKLGEHPQYKFYAEYFLGDAPSGTANRHYVRPTDDEFFQALSWLEKQFGVTN